MGLVIYRATTRRDQPQPWWLMGLYVFAANAPDLDFLPGLLVGNISRFHHGPSHSIGVAIAVAAIASVFFPRKTFAFLVTFSLYFSHVLLDYLVWDLPPSRGVPLFWPFSTEYYMTPFAVFPSFYYAGKRSEFVRSVFSLHNLWTVVVEFVILAPVLLAVWYFKSRKEKLDTATWQDEAELRKICDESSL